MKLQLDLLQKHLKPADSFMDIGGGAGLTSAYAALRTRGRVVVVEPNEQLIPLLRRQIELNGMARVLL
jgi:FkbM family methyltransferase